MSHTFIVKHALGELLIGLSRPDQGTVECKDVITVNGIPHMLNATWVRNREGIVYLRGNSYGVRRIQANGNTGSTTPNAYNKIQTAVAKAIGSLYENSSHMEFAGRLSALESVVMYSKIEIERRQDHIAKLQAEVDAEQKYIAKANEITLSLHTNGIEAWLAEIEACEEAGRQNVAARVLELEPGYKAWTVLQQQVAVGEKNSSAGPWALRERELAFERGMATVLEAERERQIALGDNFYYS